MAVKNLKQANEALHRIAEIECAVSKETALKDSVIADANKSFADRTEKLEAEKVKLVEELRKFSDAHRKEFIPDGKLSADIGSGTLGYRKNPDKIEVSAETAELLEKAGLGAMVKVTKEPVKAALKNLDEAKLKEVKAKRIPGTEQFFAKANEIRLTDSQAEAKASA